MKKFLATTLVATGFLAAASLFAADAKENWTNLCAKCHGADGAGKTKIGQKLKVKDYTDAKVLAEFTDAQLAKVTAEGVSKDGKDLMKGFKDDLSPAEIDALVAYVRTLKK
jgi:cytochrome c6